MEDCFILIDDATGRVDRLVVGMPTVDGFTAVRIDGTNSHVGIGWHLEGSAWIGPAVSSTDPDPSIDPTAPTLADRIADLERQLAELKA